MSIFLLRLKLIYHKFYANGIEYTAVSDGSLKNKRLEAIYHEEGRCVPKANNVDFFYEYNLTDHLGNVRVTFRDEDNDGQVTEEDILQQNHYYPFGMQMEGFDSQVRGIPNNYIYNGKDLL